MRKLLPCVSLALLTMCRLADAQEAASSFTLPSNVQSLLGKFCGECHGKDGSEADVRLDAIGALDLSSRLSLLNKMQEQVVFKLMPPTDAPQPSKEQRQVLVDWVGGELRKHKASKLDDKRPYPDYGNLVDHDRLFSGAIQEKPFTPARRWLVSPQIFHERVMTLFKLDSQRRSGVANASFYGVQNPFLLPEFSGVRYYDLTPLDGGHLLVMQSNADWISQKQLHAARVKKGEFKKGEFPDRRDNFVPVTPTAFEVVIIKNEPPTDAEIADAVQAQFDCVLQRPATDDELKKYVELTRSAISLAGNTEGLRQMLVAVILNSEFLYRFEFGAGEPDEHGRRMLSPREASYAIAYALGDRAPDPALVKAAADGRLNTKDDYRREVQRLLADEKWFRGIVDKTSFNPYLVEWLSVSHPKQVRFFRDFFGYPAAIKIFKDIKRSNGYYRVPDRGSTQTPGQLVLEADMLVNWHLQRDQRVFEGLLTDDRFIVADAQKANATIEALNEVYDRFKDRDVKWNLDREKLTPMELSPEELKFIQKRLHYNSSLHDLNTAMLHVSHFRMKGLTPNPDWKYPFGLHMLTPHAHSYNIDPVEWDYPREQPLVVAHRKGMLTHPAWLIAHAGNFQTDPVRRGKWIREKLLAGRVPDVPITVQAQVPDDPHKGFRERVELVTGKNECWKCHQHMNPLGLPFECFDDFGRYRTAEPLENAEHLIQKATTKYGSETYDTVPVVTTGRLVGTGSPQLDGDVKDPFELIDRLAQSDRVRQSIIRYAFRFYLGRNELLSDSQTLIEADRAYVSSGGSFKAVVVSLLTSDSFMYRK